MDREKYSLISVGRDDLDILVDHRRKMWITLGSHSLEEIEDCIPAYREWLDSGIARGKVFCFKAVGEKGAIIGSVCVFFRDDIPGPGHLAASIPFVFSLYVENDFRNRGIGTELTRKCVDLSIERGYTRITLHASVYGRPIYEKMGFRPTTEMRLSID
ncbi:MAG: GNAT family N-acetyltransferase [Thermoplasmata archaeon]